LREGSGNYRNRRGKIGLRMENSRKRTISKEKFNRLRPQGGGGRLHKNGFGEEGATKQSAPRQPAPRPGGKSTNSASKGTLRTGFLEGTNTHCGRCHSRREGRSFGQPGVEGKKRTKNSSHPARWGGGEVDSNFGGSRINPHCRLKNQKKTAKTEGLTIAAREQGRTIQGGHAKPLPEPRPVILTYMTRTHSPRDVDWGQWQTR